MGITIVLINECFHNGPVICPRSVIMAKDVCNGPRQRRGPLQTSEAIITDRGFDMYTDHCNLSPIRSEFSPDFVTYYNRFSLTRIAGDKVIQLPAKGRWFSTGTSASSTSTTDRRDITEILLKVTLNHNQTNKN